MYDEFIIIKQYTNNREIKLLPQLEKKIWTVIGSATEDSLRSPILKDRYDQKIANFIFRWFSWLGGWVVG